MMRFLLQFDGGGHSHRGTPNSWGVVLCWEDGVEVAVAKGKIEDSTINEAEYTALIQGLLLLLKYAPIEHVLIQGDSELVIKHLTPRHDFAETGRFVYKCREKGLQPLQAEAWALLHQVGNYTLEHVARKRNKRADALATEALSA